MVFAYAKTKAQISCAVTLLPNSEISGLWQSPVAVQSGLCQTRLETRFWVSHDTAH